MTLDYTSLAIAGGFALAGLLALAAPDIRRPMLWLCLIAGAAAGFFAREATTLGWEFLAPPGRGLSTSPTGLAVHQLVASGIGELLKAIAPMAVIIFASTSAPTGLSYGAAAGAGFGLINAQRVLVRVLELIGSPIVTPLSTALAIAGWFFTILGHIGTTALVAWAAAARGFGRAFLLAWAIQFVLVLAQRLPVIGGVPLALPITIAVSLWLLMYLRTLRRRGGADTISTRPAATAASEP